MGLWNMLVPAVTTVVSLVFAALVLARWTQRRHLNSLLWGIGLLMFAIGSAMEFLYSLAGSAARNQNCAARAQPVLQKG